MANNFQINWELELLFSLNDEFKNCFYASTVELFSFSEAPSSGSTSSPQCKVEQSNNQSTGLMIKIKLY